jgi:hypothetical protein
MESGRISPNIHHMMNGQVLQKVPQKRARFRSGPLMVQRGNPTMSAFAPLSASIARMERQQNAGSFFVSTTRIALRFIRATLASLNPCCEFAAGTSAPQ